MNYSQLANYIYCVALCWWLCHPWASFTTGDWEPRQLYVDENALVVQALAQKGTDSRVNKKALTTKITKSLPLDLDICEQVHDIGATSCLQMGSESDGTMITQVVVDSTTKQVGEEAIAFVLPFKGSISEDAARTVLVKFIHELLNSSAWLSKRVIVLLVEVNCINIKENGNLCIGGKIGVHSKALDVWLRNYIGKGGENGHARYVATSLIREAYIMELYSRSSGEKSTPPSKSKSKLHFSGVNGALPNMDMISGVLALFEGALTVPHYLEDDPAPRDPVSWWYAFQSNLVDTTLWLLNIIQRGSNDFIPPYRANLMGLATSSKSMARGTGDGLHSQFLGMNIDSITIRTPISSKNRKPKEDTAIVRMMLKLARVSSNLYEELHHSHFFYVLMGGKRFVGLSEYCGPIGLALLSFFLEFVQSTEEGLFRQGKAVLSKGLYCAFTDIAPIVFMIAVILVDGYGSDESSMEVYATLGHCTLMWIWSTIYHYPLSEQEFASYSAVVVLLLQLACVATASIHYTLSFALTMMTIPLARLIFLPITEYGEWEAIGYIFFAFCVNPTTFYALFSQACRTWIVSWRVQYSWNFPLLYCICHTLCCGALRRFKVYSVQIEWKISNSAPFAIQ